MRELRFRQLALIRHWLIIVLVTELIMFILHRHLWIIYCIVAGCFFIGFSLRVFKLYPGQAEPLILDISGVFIALLFAYAASLLRFSGWRFVLIVFSSLIIMPHIYYIISNENP